MGVKATIIIYGDIHLSSKKYGAHNDYPKESLHYFSEITRVAKERNATHIIGTGDFTYGRFHSLEYRLKVEEQLEEQYKLTKGNRYELMGNHDTATYGLTEYQYYVQKGIIKPSTNLDIENLHITMVDHDKHNEVEPNIHMGEDDVNIIIAHDFFRFKDTATANYGEAIELDEFTRWYGADFLISGHVHKIMGFSGSIAKDNVGHPMTVHYPGCMSRPSYREGHMDEVGQVVCITVNDDNTIGYDVIDIELWKIEESFNLAIKEKAIGKEKERADRLDISDIVKQLDSHERNVGNPEDIINSLQGVDKIYKNKAIALLKEAQG